MMKRVTTTLKLKFLDRNKVKADIFAQTVLATTELANELLRLSPKERRALTTARVVTPLKSALSNQVIRILKGKAGNRAKQFQVFWPEVNNQNWKLYKVGNTYKDSVPLARMVSFPTIRGDKRVPLAVCGSYIAERLDQVLAGKNCERGTLKLIQARGAWYVVLSITWEVPKVDSTVRASGTESLRLGVDRGQNRLAVAATPQGRAIFFQGGRWHIVVVSSKSGVPSCKRRGSSALLSGWNAKKPVG